MFIDHFLLIGVSCIFLITSSVFVVSAADDTSLFENKIFLLVNNTVKQVTLNKTVNQLDDKTIWQGVCDPDQDWVICTHGWTESCKTDWMVILLTNFWKRRKCVICIDYSFFVSDTSYTGYIVSVTKFLKIANIFKRIFDKFLLAGFKSLLGMIWGMSYGGQLMIHTGKRLNIENNTLIQVGHFCDPAGPGLDCNPKVTMGRPVSDAANDTQGIHVSIDKGSMLRSSRIDWLLGKCGIHQPGSTTSVPTTVINPYGIPMVSMDHICCPNFYNWAFDFVYGYNQTDSDCCVKDKDRYPDAGTVIPDGCIVGYNQIYGCGIPKKTATGTTLTAYIPNQCSDIKSSPPP